MSETVLRFGPQQRLVGIKTSVDFANSKMGVLLLNSGVIPRLGPHRVNVRLARRLAAQGVSTLRFDLSGLGDSAVPTENRAWEEQAVADIQSAIDAFSKSAGVERVALVGICSGADNALAAAAVDTRIAALFLIDGYTYPTFKTTLVRWRKALQPTRLARRLKPWLLGKLDALWQRLASPHHTEASFDRLVPTADEFAARLQQLVDRGVSVHLLYSGSLYDGYNYPRQFEDRFKQHAFVRQVQYELCPEIDHTMTTQHAQRLLQDKVVNWVNKWQQSTSPDAHSTTSKVLAKSASA